MVGGEIRKMPSISQLEYAIAVDTHRHFARAAKACFVTQPTLSAQLAKLEDELGVVIFDRSVQPIVPTERGHAILAQARQVVAEFKKVQAVAAGVAHEVVGDFIIGVIPTVAPYVVPLFLESLSNDNPRLRIEVREMTTAAILEALDRELIDVGLLAIPVENAAYATESLFVEPFYLYVHASHGLAQSRKIKASDIDGKDIWLLEEGHCLRGQILQACKLKGRKAALTNVRFESGSIETLKRLVQNGLGYTLIPHLAVGDLEADSDQIKIVAIDAPTPAREIGMMYRRAQLKRPSLDALSQAIKKNLPRSLIAAGKNVQVIGVE
jgi:LysR family hydrogen peroxide-inducible transcriptional activator